MAEMLSIVSSVLLFNGVAHQVPGDGIDGTGAGSRI